MGALISLAGGGGAGRGGGRPPREEVLVRHCRALGEGLFLLELRWPQAARAAGPGQFIHLAVGEGYDPLLRRPFSVCRVRREEGVVEILFQVRGRGSAWLAGRRPGERLDALGPLGRGFTLPPAGREALLVGGGLGLAPLVFLAKELLQAGVPLRLLVGAAARQVLPPREWFGLPAGGLEFATEDGCLGHRGVLTELLPAAVDGRRMVAYACGPRPLLRQVAAWARARGVELEVSLEETMACGLGLCYGCACRVSRDGGAGYARVCAEGPVFSADEVVWDA